MRVRVESVEVGGSRPVEVVIEPIERLDEIAPDPLDPHERLHTEASCFECILESGQTLS